MSTTTYAMSVNGQQYTVSADWAQASSPVEFDGSLTQYQVADFRHSSTAAMLRNIANDFGVDDDDLEDADSSIDLSDMVAYEVIDGDAIRLVDDADTEHQSAEEMYDAFGWHLTTEAAGDIELQSVSYENAADDVTLSSLIELLVEENDGLTEEEAVIIAEKAREIRDFSDSIESLLKAAVSAYESDDVRECVRQLGAASSAESDAGDDPASRSLSAALIEKL